MRVEATSVNNIPIISSLKSTDYITVLYDDDGKLVWRRIAQLDIGNFTITKGDITKYDYSYADLSLGIDNVPVDGQVNEPISSNWAYDHSNTKEAHWSGEQIQDEVGSILDDGSSGNVVFTYDDNNNVIYGNVNVIGLESYFTGQQLTNGSITITHDLGVTNVILILSQDGVEVNKSNYKLEFLSDTQCRVTLQYPYNDTTRFNYRIK
jgi:ribosomal protein L24